MIPCLEKLNEEGEKGMVNMYMNIHFWIYTENIYIKRSIIQASNEQTPTACGFILPSHTVPLSFRLGVSLQACLLQIVGYRNLIADVEKLRREPYDSDNPQHEEMLLKVSVLRCCSGVQT